MPAFVSKSQAQENHSHGSSDFVGPQQDTFSSLMNDVSAQDQSGCMTGETFTQNNSVKRKIDVMPDSYFYGMITSFAKNQCLEKKGGNHNVESNLAGILNRPPTESRDALFHYAGSGAFQNTSSNLVKTYSLLFHLGMHETDGRPKEGKDQKADYKEGQNIEAGLFQVSSVSLNFPGMRNLYKQLKESYKRNGQCMIELFKGKDTGNSESHGAGEAFEFQQSMKNCPALAVDFMAALSRKTVDHNGPLKWRKLEPRTACVNVLNQVAKNLENRNINCESMVPASGDFTRLSGYRKGLMPDSMFQTIDRGNVLDYDPLTREGTMYPPGGSGQQPQVFRNDEQEAQAFDKSLLNDLLREKERKEAAGEKDANLMTPAPKSESASGDSAKKDTKISAPAASNAEIDQMIADLKARVTKVVKKGPVDSEAQLKPLNKSLEELKKSRNGGRGESAGN